MRKLLGIFIVLFSLCATARVPDIVAVVNDKPITMHEFLTRKKMVIALNNIDNSDPSADKKLNNDILNILIEEELLNQHAEKVGGTISAKEITNAIDIIEQRNKMSKGQLMEFMKSKGVDLKSFRQQVKGELIKYNIISSLSNSVSVSPQELDVAVINSGSKDFDIEALVFTSKGEDGKVLKQMERLKKQLTGCDKVVEKLYKDFAQGERLTGKLKQLDSKTQSVILDTKVGASSNIYKETNKFKLVLVCKKKAEVSGDDINQIKSFLSNKKMTKKAAKFFKDLRSRAYIKVMTP